MDPREIVCAVVNLDWSLHDGAKGEDHERATCLRDSDVACWRDLGGTAGDDGSGLAGMILTVPRSQSAELEKSLPKLRSSHPELRFVVLDPDGKQPEVRGSLVIKRGSVLEVSSPTAQPWIDTNLALVKIEQRSHQGQVPLYTFSWGGLSASVQPQTPLTTAGDR